MRELKGVWKSIFGALAIVWCAIIVYSAYAGAFRPIPNRALFGGFAIIMCFALFPFKKASLQHRPTIPDILFMILGMIPIVYAIIKEETFLRNIGEYTTLDLVLAAILILVIFEAGRRSIGLALPIIVVCAGLYGYFGEYMPGSFKHRSMNWVTMIDTLYRTDLGLWGPLLGIGATVIGIFVIFSGVLMAVGAADCLKDIALKLTGKYRGGAGLIVPVMDLPLGTATGSAAVNVAASGVFTIPLMKQAGYTPTFAGAVEASSSTGSQLVPPIMGAGAFLMAEITGIPYVNICIAAIVPAVLYYIIVFFSIYFEGRRLGLGAVPKELIPKWRQALAYERTLPLFMPITVLIYFMYAGYSISYGCFWSIVSGLAIFAITSPRKVPKLSAMLWSSMNDIMGILAILGVVLLLAGIVVGLIGSTGLGVAVSSMLVQQAGMSLLFSLILSGLVLIILGMGMPTAASYAVGAAVLGPVLISLEIPLLPAHMFIFYFALISAITPPVAGAVYPACAIAGSPFWPTAWTACRIGAGIFLLPFAFVYDPDILFGVTPFSIFGEGLAVLRILLVAFLVSGGAVGWLLYSFTAWQRILLVIAGMLLVVPDGLYNPIGLSLGIVILLYQGIMVHRREGIQKVTLS